MISLYLICSVGRMHKHLLVATTFLWQDSEYWTIWNPWKVVCGLLQALDQVLVQTFDSLFFSSQGFRV